MYFKDRLSRLEAALLSKKDDHNEEHLKTISELQTKLDSANNALIEERKKASIIGAPCLCFTLTRWKGSSGEISRLFDSFAG
uniref:Uncharacterized protein n=1 Tax=Cucumis melo TaxID=3656 RepID=A0A9I9E073_CUCME